MRRIWAVGGALGLLAGITAACGSGAPPGPGATVPRGTPTAPATSSTTATTGPDPYAVPPVITKPYVQRVLDALEAVNGQATRLIVANKSFVPAAAARLRAIDSRAEFAVQSSIWSNDLAHGLANYVPDPKDVVDQVTGIVTAAPSCVFLTAARNYTGVDRDPPPLHTSFFALKAKPILPGSEAYNATPWVISFLGYTASGSEPPNPCASSS